MAFADNIAAMNTALCAALGESVVHTAAVGGAETTVNCVLAKSYAPTLSSSGLITVDEAHYTGQIALSSLAAVARLDTLTTADTTEYRVDETPELVDQMWKLVLRKL